MRASWSGRDKDEQGNHGIKLAPRPKLMGRLEYAWKQGSPGGGQKEKQAGFGDLQDTVSESQYFRSDMMAASTR